MVSLFSAKDLILINYAHDLMSALNSHAAWSRSEDTYELVDQLYTSCYVPIIMSLFNYEEAVSGNLQGSHDDLIKHYQDQFRDEIFFFIHRVDQLRLGIPRFYETPFANVCVDIDSEEDTSEAFESRSKRKLEEKGTDIVFWEDSGYYSIMHVEPDGRKQKYKQYDHSVPRFVPDEKQGETD